jgi:8-oxo-dGTP diphosphatase
MTNHPLIVAAGLIRRGRKVLVTQRSGGSFRGLCWEFPGGKLRYGETIEQCLGRELREELGIETGFKGFYGVNSHVYSDVGRHVVIILCECGITSEVPSPLHCNDVKWVPVDDLDAYNFVEADKPFVDRLLKEAGLDNGLEESQSLP